MTLQLTTPLNKDEEDRVFKYNTNPWAEMYQDENESSIFQTASALRKQNELSKIDFTPEDSDTYKNLIINKPREWAPAYNIFKTLTSPWEALTWLVWDVIKK